MYGENLWKKWEETGDKGLCSSCLKVMLRDQKENNDLQPSTCFLGHVDKEQIKLVEIIYTTGLKNL